MALVHRCAIGVRVQGIFQGTGTVFTVLHLISTLSPFRLLGQGTCAGVLPRLQLRGIKACIPLGGSNTGAAAAPTDP